MAALVQVQMGHHPMNLAGIVLDECALLITLGMGHRHQTGAVHFILINEEVDMETVLMTAVVDTTIGTGIDLIVADLRQIISVGGVAVEEDPVGGPEEEEG